MTKRNNLSDLQLQDAALTFFTDLTLPNKPALREAVLCYLKEVFLGASRLPKDPEALEFWHLHAAHIRGYQHLLFGEKPDRVPKAYARAYRGFLILIVEQS
jgi:hypothetical protein